jgi:hypothetical protein
MTTTQHPCRADMPAIFIDDLMVVPSRGVAWVGRWPIFCCGGLLPEGETGDAGVYPRQKVSCLPLLKPFAEVLVFW